MVLLFQGRDVGPDPPGGSGNEKIPAQDRATSHKEADKAEGRGEIIEIGFYIRKRQNTVAQYIVT